MTGKDKIRFLSWFKYIMLKRMHLPQMPRLSGHL